MPKNWQTSQTVIDLNGAVVKKLQPYSEGPGFYFRSGDFTDRAGARAQIRHLVGTNTTGNTVGSWGLQIIFPPRSSVDRDSDHQKMRNITTYQKIKITENC